jgi:predicted small metal-binding protein
MKDFHCSDAGMKCDFVARGDSKDDILKKASEHAQQVHHLTVTAELSKKVESLIHDESSDAHRKSMQK